MVACRNVFVTTVIFIFFFSSVVAESRHEGKLRLRVGHFYPLKGNLVVLVFDSTASSLSSEKELLAIRRYSIPVHKSHISFSIDSLPKGRYAIKAFHDEDGNGKFEFTREDFGFSGSGRGMGLPNFKEASFYFDGADQQLILTLENELASTSSTFKNSVAFSPVFGYTPETSALLGANMFKLFKHKGSDSLTRTSYADVLAIATLNKQLVLEQNYTLFTRGEKYLLNGFTGFSKFPQYYYGIGNVENGTKDIISYNQFRFDHLIMRRLHKKIFVGIGYRYNTLFHVIYGDDTRFASTPVTGSNGAMSSGVQIVIASDTRNNVYNTSRGHLLRWKSIFNATAFGSQFTFRAHEVDLRGFTMPFRGRRDVLAVQAYGYFTAGNVPWNEMGTMGNDMIMRGYYSGRYRDRNYAAGQAEYRLNFNKMFGAVGFAGLGEVADKLNHFSAHFIKPNFGAGFRMTVDRRERLNLRLDMGYGQHTSNVYFTLAEAF